jgi:hypothetical protein
MTPQAWIGLSQLVLTVLLLMLGAGLYFGRQEARGTRKDDNGSIVVARAPDPLLVELNNECRNLTARLTTLEKEWRENRKIWHSRFETLEKIRFAALVESDRIYVRKDTAAEQVNGLWSAIKGLQRTVARLEDR